MKRKTAFLTAQALLCVLIAGLLAAGALSLYLEGAARQAEGDLFSYMFTRERATDRLRPILPLMLCSLGLTAAGVMLGIGNGEGDCPGADEKRLREIGSVQARAVRARAERKTALRTAVLVIAAMLIAAGILTGGLTDVMEKGAAVCAECVGLG